jgi:hypothetical protein
MFSKQTRILGYAVGIDFIGASLAAFLVLERVANKVGLKINERNNGTIHHLQDVDMLEENQLLAPNDVWPERRTRCAQEEKLLVRERRPEDLPQKASQVTR